MRYGLRCVLAASLLLLVSCAGDTPPPGAAPPAAPTDVRATPVPGGIEVTWADTSDDEDGFRIYRDATAGGRSGQRRDIGTVGPNTASYLDADAVVGIPYRYSVAAYNGARESEPRRHDGDPVSVDPASATLTVEVLGSGAGGVASDPPGIDCGTTCSAPFASGSTVVLTAAPAIDSTFEGWQGACAGTDRVCSVVIDDATNVTATFALRPPPAPDTVRLSVLRTGDGTVTSTPAGIDCGEACVADFAEDATVILQAVPDAGATFVGWSGACSGSATTCTVDATGGMFVHATFGTTAIVVTTDAGGSSRNECTLRDAIEAANTDSPAGGCSAGEGADSIVLPSGAEIVLLAADNDTDGPNGLPSIHTEIAILGNGATVARSEVADPFRIFHLGYGGDLTLRDVTVFNGFDDLSLRETDDGHGAGAIYNRGNLTLQNVTVRSNSTFDPSYLSFDSVLGAGGILSEEGSLVILGSSIVENSSRCGNGCSGGIAVLAGLVEIRDSTISFNEAVGDDGDADGGAHGGGLSVREGTATIASTTFEGNRSGVDWGVGGAVGTGRRAVVDISDSSFSRNYASIGGAISNAGNLRVARSTVEGDASYRGGAMNNTGALDLSDSEVEGGDDAFFGGGIFNSGRAIVSTTTIAGCGEDGGAIFNEGEFTLADGSTAHLACEPDRNVARGVIYNDGSDEQEARLFCDESTVSGGRSWSGGGGVYNHLAMFNASNCVFEDNEAAGDGGGIYSTGPVSLVDSIVRGNVADSDDDKEGAGGGVFIAGEGRLNLRGTTIGGTDPSDANSARTGGGLYLMGKSHGIVDSAIVGNAADSNGGGLVLDLYEDREARERLDLNATTIRANTANIDGGGLYLLRGDAHIDRSDVVENVADVNENGTGRGGGIYLTQDGAFTQDGGTIEDNAPDDVFDAGVGSPGDFDIELRFGPAISSAQQQVFVAAATRWMTVVVGDVADIPNVDKRAGACGEGEPAESGTIDDVVVFAEVAPIDGPGGTLGYAGPCLVRTSSMHTAYGVMRFDSADVAALESSGSFVDVILHEMGHVLGVGSLWDAFALLDFSGGSCLASPSATFVGAGAGSEYAALGGSGGVPVEDQYGRGTQCSHWDEATFDRELMTGFVEPGGVAMPLSRMTIASLADMGYEVDLTTAESYRIPSCSPTCLRSPDALDLGAREIVLEPRYTIGPDGTLTPIDGAR